jgi:hypothetical protein
MKFQTKLKYESNLKRAWQSAKGHALQVPKENQYYGFVNFISVNTFPVSGFGKHLILCVLYHWTPESMHFSTQYL